MTRIISVISGKGGVGKTTVVANLGAALANNFGKSVTIVDGNLSTSNLGLAYGLYNTETTLNHVLRGDAYLSEAIYIHDSGVRLIPASLDLNDFFGIEPKHLNRALSVLFGYSDFVLVDSAPGINEEAIGAIAAGKEILYVTTPHMPALVDLSKSHQISEELGGRSLGVIVNRVKDRRYEFNHREIEEMLRIPVVERIPEDENVLRSANSDLPAVLLQPHAHSLH